MIEDLEASVTWLSSVKLCLVTEFPETEVFRREQQQVQEGQEKK
jgi:hypothetical protein